MIIDFSATSEELAASIQNMLKAINEISVANNEAASGTSSIAEKTANVSEKANEVLNLALGGGRFSTFTCQTPKNGVNKPVDFGLFTPFLFYCYK